MGSSSEPSVLMNFCSFHAYGFLFWGVYALPLGHCFRRRKEDGDILAKVLLEAQEPQEPMVTPMQQAMQDLFTWARAEGAQVNEGLKGRLFEHGGHDVRGVGATEALDNVSHFLEIPRKLWITGAEVPSLASQDLRSLPECKYLSPGDWDTVGHAVTLSVEQYTGKASKWYNYVSGMPTLDDYRSFMPQFADTQLLSDFAGLGFFKRALADLKKSQAKRQACLDKVREQMQELKSMTDDDMERWLLVSLTRRYNVTDSKTYALTVLVPIPDMMNTANKDDINTQWDAYANGDKEGMFTVSASVPPGQELYDAYCMGCSNTEMLYNWGIFLDGNPNRARDPLAECPTLREPTEEVLDLHAPRATGNGPPCRASDSKRCSIARLAHEICGEAWQLGLVRQKWPPGSPEPGLKEIKENMSPMLEQIFGMIKTAYSPPRFWTASDEEIEEDPLALLDIEESSWTPVVALARSSRRL